jgi:hypothetical protein
MALKSSGTGSFLIPAAPAVGVTVAGGAANTFTTNAVQLIASTSAAIFITGLHVQLTSTSKPTYVVIRLSTGAADGSIVGEFVVPYAYTAGAAGTQVMGYVKISPWIAVAASTRIGAKSADSVGSLNHTVILQCINQSNVVDAALSETILTVTGNVNGSVASVTGAVGSVTGSVGSVTGAVGSVTAGVTVTTNNDKTGYGLSAAAVQAVWDALTSALTTVGSIGKMLVDRIDAAITSRLAPTTAGRTLDVTAAGNAGVDWNNIETPNATVNLSGTTISSVTGQINANVVQWNSLNVPASSSNGVPKVDISHINGSATNGNNATLSLKKLDIRNNAGDAVLLQATGGAGKGLILESTSSAAVLISSTVDDGIYITASGTGVSVNASNGNAVAITATGPSTDGIIVSGTDYGIRSLGDVAGASFEGTAGVSGNADGIRATPAGTGKSISATSDIALPSGDLDDQLQALPTAAENATATWASGTRTLTSFGTLVADIWATAIETGYTAKQSMRLILSALAGKLSGAATTNVQVRNVTDTKTRIDATVDADGNRTAVTHDTTD